MLIYFINTKKEIYKMSTKLLTVTLRIDADIVINFREKAKESGYKQNFLVKKALLDIINDLDKKANEDMGGLFDEKQSK